MEHGNSEASLELALADVEILESAYPDEIRTTGAQAFPLSVTLNVSELAFIEFELVNGYPTSSNVRVARYRSTKPSDYTRLEVAVAAARTAAQECLEEQIEGGLACCAAAMEAWNSQPEETSVSPVPSTNNCLVPPSSPMRTYDWITGEPLVDRKSTFQAHLCLVQSEPDVRSALDQLLSIPRIQRATHNMYAYRFTESNVLKHDNDDDGEDAAGSRLAHLLHMRDEDGVLVVVSRWYGGILLGPKRFAHITNVARTILAENTFRR